jgi:hypothetical protein
MVPRVAARTVAVLILFTFSIFADDGLVAPLDESRMDLAESSVERPLRNPHSKALGMRIAGGVLLGLGGVNLAIGIICDAANVFEDMYADLDMGSETGAMYDKLSWIEGSVMLGIAIPLFVVGEVKYGQWKKWENEHGKSVSLQGNKLVFEF